MLRMMHEAIIELLSNGYHLMDEHQLSPFFMVVIEAKTYVCCLWRPHFLLCFLLARLSECLSLDCRRRLSALLKTVFSIVDNGYQRS